MTRARCPRCKYTGTEKLVVETRMCNYSKFNGSRYTPSSYSGIRCLNCRYPWRTRAAWVDDLRDATEAELVGDYLAAGERRVDGVILSGPVNPAG